MTIKQKFRTTWLNHSVGGLSSDVYSIIKKKANQQILQCVQATCRTITLRINGKKGVNEGLEWDLLMRQSGWQIAEVVRAVKIKRFLKRLHVE